MHVKTKFLGFQTLLEVLKLWPFLKRLAMCTTTVVDLYLWLIKPKHRGSEFLHSLWVRWTNAHFMEISIFFVIKMSWISCNNFIKHFLYNLGFFSCFNCFVVVIFFWGGGGWCVKAVLNNLVIISMIYWPFFFDFISI